MFQVSSVPYVILYTISIAKVRSKPISKSINRKFVNLSAVGMFRLYTKLEINKVYRSGYSKNKQIKKLINK